MLNSCFDKTKIGGLADKFSVLSFLEALEDSVAKTSESGGGESRQGENNDPESRRHGGGDAMDES